MINIVFEADKNRTAAYDGDKNIGECTFRVNGNVWEANHTYVDKNYGGQGIAKKLLEELVKNAREQGVKILPICSFVVKEFERTEEYKDLL